MKNEMQFHPNPKELWDQFHGVGAPVIVLDGYNYERKYVEEPIFGLHPDDD